MPKSMKCKHCGCPAEEAGNQAMTCRNSGDFYCCRECHREAGCCGSNDSTAWEMGAFEESIDSILEKLINESLGDSRPEFRIKKMHSGYYQIEINRGEGWEHYDTSHEESMPAEMALEKAAQDYDPEKDKKWQELRSELMGCGTEDWDEAYEMGRKMFNSSMGDKEKQDRIMKIVQNHPCKDAWMEGWMQALDEEEAKERARRRSRNQWRE